MKKSILIPALIAVMNRSHSLAEERKRPSTLAQQVAYAQAEYESWTPEFRASVKLEGGDQ